MFPTGETAPWKYPPQPLQSGPICGAEEVNLAAPTAATPRRQQQQQYIDSHFRYPPPSVRSSSSSTQDTFFDRHHRQQQQQQVVVAAGTSGPSFNLLRVVTEALASEATTTPPQRSADVVNDDEDVDDDYDDDDEDDDHCEDDDNEDDDVPAPPAAAARRAPQPGNKSNNNNLEATTAAGLPSAAVPVPKTIVASDGDVSNGFVKDGKMLPYVFEASESGDRKRSSKILPVCGVCGKRFVCVTTMKRHLVTHTGEKPFSCKVCGKQYTQKGNLRVHERTHRNDRPFECSICHQKFYRKEPMQKHQWRQHGIVHLKSTSLSSSLPSSSSSSSGNKLQIPPQEKVHLQQQQQQPEPSPYGQQETTAASNPECNNDLLLLQKQQQEGDHHRIADQGPLATSTNVSTVVPIIPSYLASSAVYEGNHDRIIQRSHQRLSTSFGQMHPPEAHHSSLSARVDRSSSLGRADSPPLAHRHHHLNHDLNQEPARVVHYAEAVDLCRSSSILISRGGSNARLLSIIDLAADNSGHQQDVANRQDNVFDHDDDVVEDYGDDNDDEDDEVDEEVFNFEEDDLDNNSTRFGQDNTTRHESEKAEDQDLQGSSRPMKLKMKFAQAYQREVQELREKEQLREDGRHLGGGHQDQESYTVAQQHHLPKYSDPLQCIGCCQVFPHKPSLKAHQMAAAEAADEGQQPQRPFRCCQCGYRFRQKAHLQKHQWRIHRKSADPADSSDLARTSSSLGPPYLAKGQGAPNHSQQQVNRNDDPKPLDLSPTKSSSGPKGDQPADSGPGVVVPLDLKLRRLVSSITLRHSPPPPARSDVQQEEQHRQPMSPAKSDYRENNPLLNSRPPAAEPTGSESRHHLLQAPDAAAPTWKKARISPIANIESSLSSRVRSSDPHHLAPSYSTSSSAPNVQQGQEMFLPVYSSPLASAKGPSRPELMRDQLLGLRTHDVRQL